MDCDGEMKSHPDWFKVCGECNTVLENVSIHGAESEDDDSTNCGVCEVKIGYDEAIHYEELEWCEKCYEEQMERDMQNYTHDETDCISCGFAISPNDVRVELVEGLCPDCNEYKWNNGEKVLCCCSEPTRKDDFCPEGGYNNSGDECKFECGHEECEAEMKAKYGAESFGAEEFFRCKNCDYNVELEVEAVFEDGLCSNCLVKEGFQKEYGTHGKWMKNGEYAKKIKGATYEDYDAESFEAEYNLIGRRKPRKLSLKVSDLKEALENANDDADVFVGDITPVWEEMIGEPIVSAPRGVWTNGEEVYIVGATDWIHTEQIDELTWNRVNRAKGAESFEAEDKCECGGKILEIQRCVRCGAMADEECPCSDIDITLSCVSCGELFDAESFEAHDHSHIYPSEELTPSHSHSSETFKSSNNNNNIMAAESKFDKLSDKIAKQYRKKGMSAKKAKEIGNKTAYTIGRKKYGKAGMAKKARAGMRAESFEADGDIHYVVETIKNNKVISKSKHFNNSKDALKLFKKKTSNKSKDEEIQVMEYRDYGKAGKDKGNLFGESIYADEQGVYGAESFEANEYSYYHRKKAARAWRKNYEESGILEDREKWNELYDSFDKYKSQGFSKGQSMVKSMKEMGIYNQLMQGVNVYAFLDHYDRQAYASAESFEADDDYVIVDRGNYRVRVHKKNLDRFNRSTMHKIHSERNKEGLMYDEETSRWIPLEAESFEAQGNPDKTTTSINPKFFVGKGDGDDLRGKGKFMKYNDALAKAQEVAEKEGKSRVVNNRGFALWTHDGQGLFQKGKSTAQAKKYYRAEEYSIGSGFRLGFGLGLGMLALSTVTTIAALAASTIDERQVEK